MSQPNTKFAEKPLAPISEQMPDLAIANSVTPAAPSGFIPKSGKLGRGLDSLLGPTSQMTPLDKKEGLTMLPLSALTAGTYQPRTNFSTEEMQDLTDSIRENGVLQPILVRPTGKTDKFDNILYEIIAGERRWRASKEAGRKTIPVVIKHLTDKKALESGLIENIQRHDLNPLEEAVGYDRLLSEFNYTQANLSKSLGKSRSHIANTLRLLSLPDSVQKYVRDSLISAGHARTLINFPKATELARLIVDKNLSVRQTERLVADYNKSPFDLNNPPSRDGEENPILEVNTQKKEPSSSSPKRILSEGREDVTALEDELSKALSLKSTITFKSDQSGHVQIRFKNPTELDKLMSLFFGAL
ncbi:MAG: ParB/RepB/Spo0J family partition protein [Alphaproteobacteria bacterium]|nr:ParB/RepB/Spo0J family partition protein [Alphaproteobacteria bacterium]